MSDSNRTGLNNFYLATFANDGSPVLWAHLGARFKLAGILLQGMGTSLLAILPTGNEVDPLNLDVAHPTKEEWSEIIRISDDPVILMPDPNDPTTKIFLRKAANVVHSEVQQYVWARDDFTCVFCGRRMGQPHVVMSIDHFVPLELGGANVETNYITACTKCNKDKGHMHPEDFCKKKGYDYLGLVNYLARVGGGI